MIIFEALCSDSGENTLVETLQYSHGRQFALQGPWQQDYQQVNKGYLSLSVEQQKKVCALEDYTGHHLLGTRYSMPEPFTYLSTGELMDMISEVSGFFEEDALRLVLGASSIMPAGPPSVRFVFKKKNSQRQAEYNLTQQMCLIKAA